jgi:hypothetical protein
VFIKRVGDKFFIVGCHVDDCVVAFNCMQMRDEVVAALKGTLAPKTGPLDFILGMQVTRDRAARTVKLTQTQYVKDLLRRFNLEDVRPVATPADPSVTLSVADCPVTETERQVMQSLPFLELGGSLLFLARYTRPGIAFAVNNVLRFTANPSPQCWTALKRIVRYLAGTLDHGVTLGGLHPIGPLRNENLQNDFYAYVDSAHAPCVDTRRSTTGQVIYLNGGPISWHVKYQRTVMKSSTAAEYFAVDDASQDILLLRLLASELGFQQHGPTIILEDNQSAIRLLEGTPPSDATKHLAIRHFIIRELVADGTIAIRYCGTQEMVADILTKPLGRVLYERLCVPLRGCPPDDWQSL